MLCDNEELARNVMTEIYPKVQKDIGKQAALLPSFQRKEWDTQCKTVVRRGNIAKVCFVDAIIVFCRTIMILPIHILSMS